MGSVSKRVCNGQGLPKQQILAHYLIKDTAWKTRGLQADLLFFPPQEAWGVAQIWGGQLGSSYL